MPSSGGVDSNHRSARAENFLPASCDALTNPHEAGAEAASIVSPWQAELALLQNAPQAIADGCANRVIELAKHPSQAIAPLLTGAALGAGLSALASSRRAVWQAMTRQLGKYALWGTAVDLTCRVAPPVYQTWMHPESEAQQEKWLGQSLGKMGVDFGLMGLGGWAGGRAFATATSILPGKSAVHRDPIGLIKAFRENFAEMELQTGPKIFTREVLAELSDAKKGIGQTLLSTQLDNSAQLLEDSLGTWCFAHNLPHTKVRWMLPGPDKFVGWSSFFKPRIKLSAHLLANASDLSMANINAHEITHTEQAVTMMRRIADLIGIGERATPTQMKQLGREYGNYVGHRIRQSFIEDMLTFRHGEPLTPAQAARADRFLAARGWEKEVYSGLAEANDMKEQARGMSVRVGEPGGAREVAESIRANERCRTLVAGKGKTLPEEVRWVMESIEPGRMWTETEENQFGFVLQNHLELAEKRLTHEAASWKRHYFDLPTEREAYSAGHTVAWQMFLQKPKGKLFVGLGTAVGSDAILHVADRSLR